MLKGLNKASGPFDLFLRWSESILANIDLSRMNHLLSITSTESLVLDAPISAQKSSDPNTNPSKLNLPWYFSADRLKAVLIISFKLIKLMADSIYWRKRRAPLLLSARIENKQIIFILINSVGGKIILHLLIFFTIKKMNLIKEKYFLDLDYYL
ncbi:hypothetical protein BpHYR1_022800 [Brachionus plicatilis]|uniref:Uncharacterized protein n=1 Tax=Brachionus plicatilis TaxID=10195 RepID=A0A3M7SYY9_BRAPC|nr:hypothetical protein BpHYR1_022800 [Brachionus plicatilis]